MTTLQTWREFCKAIVWSIIMGEFPDDLDTYADYSLVEDDGYIRQTDLVACNNGRERWPLFEVTERGYGLIGEERD